ncbi:kinesin-like protein KIF2C [Oryctolagus cuniculus]|uniref:kinesin-like protein KIF2C n=1 Tax=Oryctolagus cuniculus TaxID=9986 RepID=UPI00387906E3
MTVRLVGGYQELLNKYFDAIPSVISDGNWTAKPECYLPRPDAFHIFRDPVSGDIPWPGLLFGVSSLTFYFWSADQDTLATLRTDTLELKPLAGLSCFLGPVGIAFCRTGVGHRKAGCLLIQAHSLSARDVFLLKNQPRYRNLGLEVYVTFFEIYNGKLFDLLNKKAKLRVLEDGKQQAQVVGLQGHLVNSADDVIRMIDMGSTCSTSGQTFAISNSSRSHACFQILLRAKGRMHGKFSLVDLAGNEQGAATSSADWQTRMESAEINKSLLALKECIRALGQNEAHTPFCESKLTQVLRDSFIRENSRTCMIAMISPGVSSCENTLNPLHYADSVKELNPHSGPSGEKLTQMETEEMEASSKGARTFSNEEDELSSQVSSFSEATTQSRELEERAKEELKEIVQQGPGWLELSKMTEQPDYDLETFVNKAESALVQQAKHFSALRDVIKALRVAMQLEEQASRQISSKKRPQ